MILYMELWLFFDVKIRKLSLKHQTQSYGFYILCSTDFWKLLGDMNMIRTRAKIVPDMLPHK